MSLFKFLRFENLLKLRNTGFIKQLFFDSTNNVFLFEKKIKKLFSRKNRFFEQSVYFKTIFILVYLSVANLNSFLLFSESLEGKGIASFFIE